ncbi:MAG TPA: hypothetical protein VKB64_05830 [Gaiellaceae bacterium]|nr:hypothetical protein [Gaiellaceae bacterium]
MIRRTAGLYAPGANNLGDSGTKLFIARFEYHEAVADEAQQLIQKWRDDLLATRPDMIKAWDKSDIYDETAEEQVVGEVWFEGDEIVRERWSEGDEPPPSPS